jgi:hypothetical protein
MTKQEVINLLQIDTIKYIINNNLGYLIKYLCFL